MNSKPNQTQPTTAILIFTRSPKEECRFKKLHSNTSINLQLHTALYNKTIRMVEATGLPFFIVDKSEQPGDGFGGKLAHSINAVFSKNFKEVITIGNDCAQLSTEILLQAAGELKQNNLVLGPDRRGGVYLIGISAALFNATTISAIPWQTNAVYSSLLNQLGNIKTDTAILCELSDFNKLSDYYFFKNILFPLQSFIRLITAILFSGNVQGSSTIPFRYNFHFVSSNHFRGPPVYC